MGVQQSLRVFACTASRCTMELCRAGNCYEESAKSNKLWRCAIAGPEDVFPSTPSLQALLQRRPACPSASLSHQDYVRHNLGLHHCLEYRAYIFQSRELIRVLRSFPCPRRVTRHQGRAALHAVISGSHAAAAAPRMTSRGDTNDLLGSEWRDGASVAAKERGARRFA